MATFYGTLRELPLVFLANSHKMSLPSYNDFTVQFLVFCLLLDFFFSFFLARIFLNQLTQQSIQLAFFLNDRPIVLTHSPRQFSSLQSSLALCFLILTLFCQRKMSNIPPVWAALTVTGTSAPRNCPCLYNSSQPLLPTYALPDPNTQEWDIPGNRITADVVG